MKLSFPDTLLTRSILLLVTALILAHVLAIVSFKLIAENLFAAMQRSAQADVAMRVLTLAGKSESLEQFADAVVDIDGVMFVRLAKISDVTADNELGSVVRHRWEVSGRPDGGFSDFRLGAPEFIERRERPGMAGGGRPPGEFPDVDPSRARPMPQPADGARPELPRRPLEIKGGRPHGPFSPNGAILSIQFDDGQWANVLFSGNLPSGPPIQPFILMLSLSLFTVAITAAFAARWIYKPLNKLASAASALGRGERHMPLPESGPRDIRHVMEAFNGMATQLEAVFQSQKDVLVAIGHDLRTPITALRIRTAMITDEAEREKMDRALDQLESLTSAALMAGTIGVRAETRDVIELGALIESLCDDLTDVGLPVICEEFDDQWLVQGSADDLMRALRNIIENAVRYGVQARIKIVPGATDFQIVVDDDGPGIPEDQMARVFDPLVRLESSRSNETGGNGLGLHIARSTIVAHGGSITLENRDGGGLRATITLPQYKGERGR